MAVLFFGVFAASRCFLNIARPKFDASRLRLLVGLADERPVVDPIETRVLGVDLNE